MPTSASVTRCNRHSPTSIRHLNGPNRLTSCHAATSTPRRPRLWRTSSSPAAPSSKTTSPTDACAKATTTSRWRQRCSTRSSTAAPTSGSCRQFASGIQASTQSHRLEVHIGFELLYLAHNSALFSECEPGHDRLLEERKFIAEHPLFFIGRMHEKAVGAQVTGHYAPLIELAWGVLLRDTEDLSRAARTSPNKVEER